MSNDRADGGTPSTIWGGQHQYVISHRIPIGGGGGFVFRKRGKGREWRRNITKQNVQSTGQLEVQYTLSER